MLTKHKALLISKIRYGDNSTILKAFTLEEGTVSFFQRTSAAGRSRKIPLQSLSFVETVSYRGKGELLHLREIRHYKLHYNLSQPAKAATAIFLNEILAQVLREYHKDEALYSYLEESIDYLNDTTGAESFIHIKILLELSRFFGFGPGGKFSRDTPFFDLYEGSFCSTQTLHGAEFNRHLSELFSRFIESPAGNCMKIDVSEAERQSLLSGLIDYYRIHIDSMKEIRSKSILESLHS